MKDLSIYVHIPFCKQRCKYCDFCTFCMGEKEQEKYFEFLQKEIESNTKQLSDYQIKSIYFGGGTPSFVNERFIQETMSTIKTFYKVLPNAECTIECNPSSCTEKKLKCYKSSGFNRISFGVQSLNNDVLRSIGRLHDKNQAVNSIKLAKKVGFDNISCDLMVGIPFQDKKTLAEDIKTLGKLNIDHISLYMLQLEEGTPLYFGVQKGVISIANDDECADLYEFAVKKLAGLGYKQYEVSNFAKDGKYSQHNLNYWRRGEYIGFGLSAHSFLNGERMANSCEFEKYYNNEDKRIEKLSSEEICQEIIMLGLRCFEGFSLSELKKYGRNMENNEELKKLLNDGILYCEGDIIKINPKYYDINNEIILKLF